MNKALLVALFLVSGCCTDRYIVKDKYVVPSFGGEATSIPPQVPALDLNKATQKDVANWMIDNEKRTSTLENKLTTIKNSSSEIVNKLQLKDGEYVIIDLSKKDTPKNESK